MSKVVDIALAEVGYKERPTNSNITKYGKWFGFDGNKWCGMFASYCYAMAGFSLGVIGFYKGFAGVPFAYRHFVLKQEISSSPVPGDIVLFDWGKGWAHCGIFIIDNLDGTFISVEGNTAIGNDSNGGEVMLRVRNFKPKKGTVAFVHPKILDKKAIS